jgi:hypothetical protein
MLIFRAMIFLFAIPSLFGKPSNPPFHWNLFKENKLSGRSRNRAGGIRQKKNPSPMKEMGLL